MISASQNPQKYNGIKFLYNNQKITKYFENIIQKSIEETNQNIYPFLQK